MSHYLDAPRRSERAAVLDRMAAYWQIDRHAELRTIAAMALADVGRPSSDIDWLFDGITRIEARAEMQRERETRQCK